MGYEQEHIPSKSDLSIADYEMLAHGTNRLKTMDAEALDFSMLGFFGEAGSLLSAVKKRKRDDIPTARYIRAVEEELGDFLWYYTLVAKSCGCALEPLAQAAANRPVRRAKGVRFSDVQSQFHRAKRAPLDRLIRQLILLAGEAGRFVDFYSRKRTTIDATEAEGHLVPIFKSLLRAASAAGIDLQDAAIENLHKTYDRWPPKSAKVYPDPLDNHHKDETEKLPRQLDICIEQRRKRNKPYVFQSCNGIYIGDPLTDNIRDEDFYRFHDVFHYAYAAKFGWSPVTRALFKLKRKSDPETDEAEDGARAILIEEGISTMIFNYAKDLHLFEGIEPGELSFELLKTIREFVAGYEVAKTPLWLWEEAILEGYECFRFLREHKKGVVHLDMTKRSLTVTALN